MLLRNSLYFITFLYFLPVTAQDSSLLKQTASSEVSSNQMFAISTESTKKYISGITDFELINGRDYFQYYYRSSLKPILFAEKESKASVTINGRKYENKRLFYDTYTDEVVFSDTENVYNLAKYYISLNRDNIDSFTFHFNNDTLIFSYYSSSDNSGFNLPDGFYEQAYSGESEYLVRHRSVVHKKNGIAQYFYSPAGYIRAEENFVKLRSSRQFARIFKGRGDEIRRILNQKGINIRRAGKNEIITVLKLIDRPEEPGK